MRHAGKRVAAFARGHWEAADEKAKKEEEADILSTGESEQSNVNMLIIEQKMVRIARQECNQILQQYNLQPCSTEVKQTIQNRNVIEIKPESSKVQQKQYTQEIKDEKENKNYIATPSTLEKCEPQGKILTETTPCKYKVHENTLEEKFTEEFESYADVLRENMDTYHRKVTFLDENKEINIPVQILSGQQEFPCKLLLDTGAQRSFVSQQFYEKHLKNHIKKKQNFIRMYGVGGNELKTSGEVELDVEIGNEIIRQRFIIAPIKEQGILGFDFCINHKAEWTWKDKELTLAQNTNIRHIEQIVKVARVTTRNQTNIPARSEIIIAGIVEHASEAAEIGIIQPQNTFLQNYPLGVAAVITSREGNSVPLRLINANEEDVKLEKNTPIALFSPAEVVTDIPVRSTSQLEGEEDNFTEDFDSQLEELSGEEKEKFHELLAQHKNQFMHPNRTLGQTGIVKHKIHTSEHPPIKQRARREPLSMQGVVKEELEKMEKKGVIEASTSAWASPVVLCKKKDGTVRFCIDYRKLNSITEKDAYPLPRIEDNLDALRGARWFSTLDLASGYWQVEMDEESKEKTAFTTKYGLYQFNVMPFGLCNAPGTFERLMETVLRGMQWERAVLYLDDIIIFSDSIQEHMNRLEEVFNRLKEANLTLKPSKCHFFQKQVEFLGHVVDRDGVHTDPKKVEAIQQWAIPKRVKEVRAFLGITGYYRKFIRDYGQIAKPLHQLTEKGSSFKWTEETNHAFESLKKALTETPVLGYPSQDPEDTFILDTDASNCHIGAVLSQMQDGKEQVIAYGSKVLSKAERNYCVTRRELLSVVHFCVQYKHYLWGRRFKLRTDHGALVWIFQFKEPEGQLARWLELLSQFDMDISHRAGKIHGNGDGLSRRPCPDDCPTCTKGEQRIQDVRDVQEPHKEETELRGRTARKRREAKIRKTQSESLEWLKKAQNEDGDIKEISTWINRPEWGEVKDKSKDLKTYWARWDQIDKEDGLWRFKWDRKGEVTWKWILPEIHRKRIILEYHENKLAGHFNVRKTEDALSRSPYYIPGLRKLALQVLSNCEVCEKTKPTLRHNKAPMKTTVADRPMQRVAIDILGPLPTTTKGNRFIIIIADYFTKWTEAYAVPNHQAATIAENVVEQFFSRFGIPEAIHSDQGRDFESRLFQELCSLLEMEKTRTTPWHPQSDGMIERFNRTIETLLRQTVNKNQKDWDDQLSYCCAAYRSSIHSTTEFTPNELMLGRNLPMPNHLIQPVPEKWNSLSEYNQNLAKKLQHAQEQTRVNNRRNVKHYQNQYNKKSWQRDLRVGNWVWLNNFTRRTGLSPKLQVQWETEPYEIIQFLSEVVVKIKKWNGRKLRVVHLNKVKKVTDQQKWSQGQRTSIATPIVAHQPKYKVAVDGFPAGTA